MNEYDQQAQAWADKWGVKMRATYVRYGPYFEDDKDSRDVWRITLSRSGRRMSFQFGQSVVESKGDATPPRLYDVLSCLQSTDPGEFERDFCPNYGYDPDSRKALRTYKACERQYNSLARLAGSDTDMLDELAEIR